MKRSIGKLQLSRETLRTLTPSAMAAALGGGSTVIQLRSRDCESQPVSKYCPATWTCPCSYMCPEYEHDTGTEAAQP